MKKELIEKNNNFLKIIKQLDEVNLNIFISMLKHPDITLTARGKKIFISRNTITYRLEKIHKYFFDLLEIEDSQSVFIKNKKEMNKRIVEFMNQYYPNLVKNPESLRKMDRRNVVKYIRYNLIKRIVRHKKLEEYNCNFYKSNFLFQHENSQNLKEFKEFKRKYQAVVDEVCFIKNSDCEINKNESIKIFDKVFKRVVKQLVIADVDIINLEKFTNNFFESFKTEDPNLSVNIKERRTDLNILSIRNYAF